MVQVMSNRGARQLAKTNQFDDIFLSEITLDQSTAYVYFLI